MNAWRWSLLSAVAVLALLIAGHTGSSTPTAAALGSPATDREFAPGELLIKARPAVSTPQVVAATPGSRALERLPTQDVVRLRLPRDVSVAEAVDRYQKLSWVEFAEPNYYVRSADLTPNDSLYPGFQDWYYDLVQGPTAWDSETGSSTVVVAVLDTGLDLDHPDLDSKIVPGAAFITCIDDPQQPGPCDLHPSPGCSLPAANDPQDDSGHGTIVGGIVGAETNNGAGVAGTAWGVMLMPVKVLDCNGSGLQSDVAKGIDHAVSNGADIINMSLASGSGTQTLKNAVKSAHDADVTIVASSGNDGINQVSYPAAYPEVIAVGATDDPPDQLKRATFSNYGPALDLVAPGVSICSTVWDNGYACGDGTSFSAPIVSGVAALLLSAHPTFTPDDVWLALTCSARDLGSSGFDKKHGYGMVQAADAIELNVNCSGPLLKGSDDAVYYVQNGLRRHIPNGLTFEARSFKWKNVDTVLDSTIAAITEGQPVLDASAKGNLLTGPGNAVYVMQGGKKRHIGSLNAFNACKYGWDAVQSVSKAALNKIPGGSKLTGPPCPRLSPSTGDIIKGAGSRVYAMQDGRRRHIPNMITLEGQGFQWGNLNVIPESHLKRIPRGKRLLDTRADGNLLLAPDGSRYVMESGAKRFIVSDTVFNDCGYGTDALQSLSQEAIDGVADGPDLADAASCPWLSPASGVLIKGSGNAVYQMQSGLRRLVPNGITFEANRFRWWNVNTIADSTLAGITEGDRLLNVSRDGNLLTGPGNAIYVMHNGKKRHIATGSVFNACGYGSDAVFTVSNASLQGISKGAKLTGAPCPWLSPSDDTLIQGTGNPVYVMSGGNKRYVADNVFATCGFQHGNVNEIADSTLNGIPSGSALTTAEC